MTTAELGDLSTSLVWAAMTVYTVALVAYTLDLARGRGGRGRRWRGDVDPGRRPSSGERR
jgi:hypothetical protein